MSEIVNQDLKETNNSSVETSQGWIIYEHYLVEKLYPDICFCTAERNYQFDNDPELCLCVHYNRRIPGEYRFIPDYQFFVTKKRMCLDIYWNLGNISDENMIIQKYIGLESVKESPYYEDFLDMKQQIDKRVKEKKNDKIDSFEYHGVHIFWYLPDENDNCKYVIYEFASKEDNEFIQVYWNNISNTWELLSVTKTSLSSLMRFLKQDFESIDSNILHLRTFVPIETIKENPKSKYYKVLEEAVAVKNKVYTKDMG